MIGVHDPDILKWIHSIFGVNPDISSMFIAIKEGNEPILKWLVDIGAMGPWLGFVYNIAIFNGQITLANWAEAQYEEAAKSPTGYEEGYGFNNIQITDGDGRVRPMRIKREHDKHGNIVNYNLTDRDNDEDTHDDNNDSSDDDSPRNSIGDIQIGNTDNDVQSRPDEPNIEFPITMLIDGDNDNSNDNIYNEISNVDNDNQCKLGELNVEIPVASETNFHRIMLEGLKKMSVLAKNSLKDRTILKDIKPDINFERIVPNVLYQTKDHPGEARMTSELRSDHGEAMTWSLCDHHPRNPRMMWSFCDHHPGKAWMTCGQSPNDVRASLGSMQCSISNGKSHPDQT
jgi:hypothetical protein